MKGRYRGKSSSSPYGTKDDPVTTEPKGEALHSTKLKGKTLTPAYKLHAMAKAYGGTQEEDIVYPTRNRGTRYDVGSSHPGAEEGPKGLAVRQLKRHASWVQNVVRQFGLLSAARVDSCGNPSLVREDREGRSSRVPVVIPMALPGSDLWSG